DFSFSSSTITNSYFDNQTTGTSSASAYTYNTVTGLPTAQLQAALPGGCSNTVWGVVPGRSYPFLLWQYNIIEGTVFASYGGAAAGSGTSVYDVINGVAGSAPMITNSSGSYLFLLPTNSIPANSSVVVYTTGTGAGLAYADGASAGVALNIYGATLNATTSASSLSSLSASINAAVASVPTAPALSSLTSQVITTSAATF